MEASPEQVTPKPKRKYKPRAICTDPELKYRYKPKPGPKPGNKARRKRYKPVRTDAEQRRFSRLCASRKNGGRGTPHHLIHIAKTDPGRLSRYGIPDGMNREMANAAWDKARAKAEQVYTQMVEQGIVAGVSPDDFEKVTVTLESGRQVEILVPKTDAAKADVALKEAMVVALGPMGNMQTKIAAINTVLKFTKSLPAQELKVSKAEDLLAAALADMKQSDAGNG